MFNFLVADAFGDITGHIRGAPDSILDFFKMVLPPSVDACVTITVSLVAFFGVVVLFRIFRD